MLSSVKIAVQGLQKNIYDIYKDIRKPFDVVKSKTLELERLHIACEILRKIIRFLYLSKKLKQHLHVGPRELTKAAQFLQELQLMKTENIESSEYNLSGIKIIDKEWLWIVKVQEDLNSQADTMLQYGMETQNQSSVASALQIYYNLNLLKEKVEQTIFFLQNKIDSSLSHTLSLQSSEDFTTNQNLKIQFWNQLEKLMSDLNNYCIQIWHLQRVLKKIKSNNNSNSLYNELFQVNFF